MRKLTFIGLACANSGLLAFFAWLMSDGLGATIVFCASFILLTLAFSLISRRPSWGNVSEKRAPRVISGQEAEDILANFRAGRDR